MPTARRRRLMAAAAGSMAMMVLSVAPCLGWSADGHRLVAQLAAATAPAELPDFFRGGSGRIAAFSVEPDMLRLHETPQLRAREYPEHYLDWELLDGATLPDSRRAFMDVLHRRGVSPDAIGMLPYAIVEKTEHLAIAFAEYRARPDDSDVRTKVLYLAGVLSHYSADLSQPLHTTVHHNGRALPDMSSPRTGIHQLVDSLLTRAGSRFAPDDRTPWPRAFADLFAGVTNALDSSHALVDRVYQLEEQLAWDEGVGPSREIDEFGAERLTAAVLFTARLFATAWEMSAGLELPEWRFDDSSAPGAAQR